MSLGIIPATTPELIEQARILFQEYAASLDFSLCFQNFAAELASLPGAYSPPSGCLLLATVSSELAGCVALHALSSETCEMKRLYVRPAFRKLGAGRALAEEVVAQARRLGYSRMRLDTIEGVMDRALGLYREMGFVEIPAYTQNPVAGALCMELKISS